MKYETIREATEAWVNEFNAFPYGMIETLVQDHIDDWHEMTLPSVNDRVYVYDLPEEDINGNEYDGTSSYGDITEVNDDMYTIELDNGVTIELKEDEFEVERYDFLPMWGTLWQFNSGCDDYWLENEGLQIMSNCGFRIYEHEEWGYFFGIDGAGYSFYENHWIPLYKARGLKWHKEEEKEVA